MRDLLVRGLSETGYVVDSAENEGDALHLLRLYDYAAAVTDWRMPEMTGVEVIRAARSHHLAVPVLMLTARDALSDRVEGLDAVELWGVAKTSGSDELYAGGIPGCASVEARVLTYRTRTPKMYAPMKQATAPRAATVVTRNTVSFGKASEADGA